MNNQQLIDPQSPVTDEELDQMIWKLERDGGMTPKLLSLMRELREVRRANPICQKCNGTGMADSGGVQHWGEPILVECDCRSAPPAPVVPPEWSIQDAVKFCKESGRQDAGSAMEAWNACRAAMLQAGNHTEQPLDMVDHFGNSNDMVKHQSNNQGSGDSGCGDEIKQPSSNQHVTQIKPVADLYGITSPTGSETSFTFDAVEARDFIDGGWSVQEYVELERYQEAMTGNSPVTPDGWIPVSERMPETDGNYWGWWSESKRQGPVWFIKSDLQAQFQSSEITHWQPLPAAPKEVG